MGRHLNYIFEITWSRLAGRNLGAGQNKPLTRENGGLPQAIQDLNLMNEPPRVTARVFSGQLPERLTPLDHVRFMNYRLIGSP